MITSFNVRDFQQAIRDRDYILLKSNLVSAINNDPTFERGEIDEVLQILQREIPEIFEKEVQLSYEERLEKSEWNTRYFSKLTYWFEKNFALSRLDYIKEVGRAVHQDTAEQYRKSSKIGNAGAGKPAPSAQRSARNTIPARPQTTSAAVPRAAAVKSAASHSATTKAAGSKHAVSTVVPAQNGKAGNFTLARVALAVGALVAIGILLYKLL